jgi:hypothetical protein
MDETSYSESTCNRRTKHASRDSTTITASSSRCIAYVGEPDPRRLDTVVRQSPSSARTTILVRHRIPRLTIPTGGNAAFSCLRRFCDELLSLWHASLCDALLSTRTTVQALLPSSVRAEQWGKFSDVALAWVCAHRERSGSERLDL